MRIAFICKRRYMSKDVILDRYARLYEIPFQLARHGHEVHGYCFSYQNANDGEWQHNADPGSLKWVSRSPGRLYLPGLIGYRRHLLRCLRAFMPDVLIGASDIPHVVLTRWLAQHLRVPYAVDLYDNFEGFGQARIPGFVPMLRRAVRNADLVTTTSEPLQALVRDTYQAQGAVMAMPSTVDASLFSPLDRVECRRTLGLPEDAALIGTAGGLLQARGIDDLYRAWSRLASKHPRVHLVLAGPTDPELPPPKGDRVHYLGAIPHADTAKLFAALDVGVIYLRDTPFGRYCFPQKAFEMLACRLPVVAADVGVMPQLLSSLPHCLFRPGDEAALANAITIQLNHPQLPQVPIEDWQAVIGRMHSALQTLVR